MFDTALIESAVPHHHLSSRSARSLSVAIGFHAVVLGALVLSALSSTGEPPEPKIPIAFPSSMFGGPPPPPPPQGGPRPIPVVLSPKSTDVRVSPIRIPDEIPSRRVRRTDARRGGASAVSRWRYKAATLNGQAVPVRLTVTVRFGLTG